MSENETTEELPVAAPAAEPGSDGVYAHIARQPILDRKQQTVGYELLARESATSTEAPKHHSRESDSALLFHALSSIASENLFGNKLAFINVRLQDLGADHYEIVKPDRIVLELPRAEGDDAAQIEAAAKAMQALRLRGFRLAAGVFALTTPYASWVEHLSYVQFDMKTVPHQAIGAIMYRLSKIAHIQILAEKVETTEDFKACFDAGFHLFQGYYFAHPQTISAKVINPAYTTVLQLLDLVNRQAEVHKLEEVLKRDPALSFKLLRYINSSGFGLMTEVTSFRHAVVILGYKKLMRWLVLLLATTPGNSSSSSQARVAITRGRMMELLCKQHLPEDECDNAFIVGVFSMLDVMLGVSMDQALSEVPLSDQVVLGIQGGGGVFTPYMNIVKACEDGDWAGIEMHAGLLSLNKGRVSMSHLNALAWVEALGI